MVWTGAGLASNTQSSDSTGSLVLAQRGCSGSARLPSPLPVGIQGVGGGGWCPWVGGSSLQAEPALCRGHRETCSPASRTLFSRWLLGQVVSGRAQRNVLRDFAWMFDANFRVQGSVVLHGPSAL